MTGSPAFVLAAALSLAACSHDVHGTTEPSLLGAPEYAVAGVHAAGEVDCDEATAVDAARVRIEGLAFHPRCARVRAGATVTWSVGDRFLHTVDRTAGAGGWRSGTLGPTATYRRRFDRPGVYYYYCRHHDWVEETGAILVVPVAPAGGR